MFLRTELKLPCSSIVTSLQDIDEFGIHDASWLIRFTSPPLIPTIFKPNTTVGVGRGWKTEKPLGRSFVSYRCRCRASLRESLT